MLFDVIIIGAGICGSMLARELSRYKLKIAVFDKENDIANGATMANSAIVHTGYDPEDDTLKAKLNVRGARLYPDICKELSCKHKVVGAFVVASGDSEEENLNVLIDRAKRRGIEHEVLTGDEARELEPLLVDKITKVLSLPTTAVIYPWEIAISCMQVAVNNGVQLYLNHEVVGIKMIDDRYEVSAGGEVISGKMILNAAGIGAEKMARMVSDKVNFITKPKKGEYYLIDKDYHLVDRVIFPVPTEQGKGVLAIPTAYGNTLIGPNNQVIEENATVATSDFGANYIHEHIKRILKEVPFSKSIRRYAGLRPSTTSKDFIIGPLEDDCSFINIASIESPGLASAPAIAEYVRDEFVLPNLEPEVNESAIMTREKSVVVADLNEEERAELIKENPAYGNMVCRCEHISEGEVVACIHETCGARSVKGVKKRVRPGMGKCQGGFCEPKIVEILSRELGIAPVDVVLDGKGSNILQKENR